VKKADIEVVDFEEPCEEERGVMQRRMFMYSTEAIYAAGAVDRILVNYPAFADAMKSVDRIFQLGREFSIQQGMQILGSTGSGKTALARHFLQSQPRSTLFEDGFGALAIRLSSRPTAGQVVGGLLRRLRYPFPNITAQTLDIKRQVLIDALKQKGTRLIFVDEAQHLLSPCRGIGRPPAMSSNVADLLRELMDEVRVGIVFMGSHELADLESMDSHLASRISARVELSGLESTPVWHAFLRSFIKQVKVTRGNLRLFKRLIAEAVLVTVDDGVGELTVPHLKLAYERVFGSGAAKGNPYAQ
jgi:hypothetical protein